MTLVKRIVEGYEQHGYSLKGTNISMNRYCTSIPLTGWLYDKNFTCIGTLNSNRRGLPKETKETKGRDENSWISCKIDKGEVTLNSYVMKTKCSGMRNVLLLQTTNPAHYVTQDKKSLSVTRYITTLRVGLTYPIKEWGHILQNIKQENRH